MKAKLTIRFISGREESFEIDIGTGKSAEQRLKDFAKDPSLLLHTGDGVVLIPASAVECMTLSLPQGSKEQFPVGTLRRAKRVK